ELDQMNFKEAKEMPDREHRINQEFLFTTNDGALYGNDPSGIQTTMGKGKNPTVIKSWNGQTGGSMPEDPTGAAGMTQYVQSVNATPFAVYNKSGNGITVFNGDVGTVTGAGSDGDPIVMYDKFADRWFVAELNGFGSGFALAVSATNNPAGAWYAYQFNMPSGQTPDYLKFSIWENGYYMTSNNGGGTVFCFERDSMLAGSPNARSIHKNFTEPNNAGFGFWLPLPADADGVLPPFGQRCPLFSYTDNGWGGGATDAVKIWSMGVTWGVTPVANITLDATIPTAAFDASYDQNWDDIKQPGNQKLDGLGGVCMYRAQWSSFIGTNRVVLNWGVKITSTHRSIKWVELRQDQTTNVWSLYQQGIYSPDSANRWCGSIAMDCNGDIALCYAKASGTIPVSLAFTGRLPTDPLGTMSLPETIVFTGVGSLTVSNRFGDYSQTSVDPADGSVFWHTGMYCQSGSKTGIYSFRIDQCHQGVGIDEPVNNKESELTVTLNNELIAVKAFNLPSDEKNVVQLYDVNGKLISAKYINPNAKSFETTIDAHGLSAGIYIIRIGTPDFQRVAKIAVQ
ncbi:MAG: T9SS type A sorting domain-containing protein, partial [Bacteroidota bacterium]